MAEKFGKDKQTRGLVEQIGRLTDGESMGVISALVAAYGRKQRRIGFDEGLEKGRQWWQELDNGRLPDNPYRTEQEGKSA